MVKVRVNNVLRLSSLDYISSLVRSNAYITDYENYLSAYEVERDEIRRGIFTREEGNATSDFLNRWPLLWEPIPPLPAGKSPEKCLYCLLPTVCLEEDIPRGWLKSAHKLPWPEGLILPVRINFFRPESEIIDGIKALLKEKLFPGFKKSVPKAKGRPDPWKVWDTFWGPGEEDIRKTAEILFPDSFRYETDQAEMEAEAGRTYEEMLKKGSKEKAMTWQDNRLSKAKVATWRQVERKKLIAYVREVIESCKEKIDTHSHVTNNLSIVVAELTVSGKDNPPA